MSMFLLDWSRRVGLEFFWKSVESGWEVEFENSGRIEKLDSTTRFKNSGRIEKLDSTTRPEFRKPDSTRQDIR